MNFSKMFVTESSIFNQAAIRLRISSLEGVNIVIEVTPETPVDQLKIGAVSQIYDSNDGNKLSLYYRLLHVVSGHVLTEENTVAQSGVKDNDELILLRKRVGAPTLLQSGAQKEATDKTPSVEEIEAATGNIAPQHLSNPNAKPSGSVEFQNELRKILVSLIDVAQKLLCLNPDSIKDVAKFIPPEKRKSETREKSPPVNEKSLSMLTSMGFDRNQAIKALRINKMSEENAIQWLIDNPVEESTQAEAVKEDATAASAAAAAPAAAELRESKSKSAEENHQYLTAQMFELAKLSGPEKVKKMLTAFQNNRRLEFKPDASAVQNLLEMGFEEDDVIEALRSSGNRQDGACDWLLNRGDTPPSEPDVKEGLDVNGAVYKAILSSHVIQLALSNPKTLIALLQILENPQTMQQWLQDPELSPLLLQVSRIYHSEKYSQ